MAMVQAATKEDLEKNKAFGILAYIGILCLVPLLAVKDSPFAKYHANQGLVLFLVEVVWGFVSGFLGAALFFTGGWWFFAFVNPLVWLALLVYSIVGIINAANGEMKPLPFIGDIKLVK